jgi:hypothetical protein
MINIIDFPNRQILPFASGLCSFAQNPEGWALANTSRAMGQAAL